MDVDSLSAEVAGAMVRAGSDTVFGLPGGGNNLSVVGAAEAAGMRFILTHTESAAAIMAGTYAELSGAPALCVVTRGPGAASAVNGCAQALLDRQPVVLLTDCVASAERDRVSHQWIDQTALFSSVAKWSGVVGGTDPQETMDRALELAMRPPAGPVHLDFDPTAEGSVPPEPTTDSSDFNRGRLSELVAGARRPVVLAGVGALAAQSQIRALLSGRNVPVLTTYKARGVVADSSPNYAGVLTGASIESPVIEAADLVIAIGLDAVELIPARWIYRAPVVSIGAWGAEVDGFHPALEAVGDLGELVAAVARDLNDDWEIGAASQFRDAAASEVRGDAAGLSPHYVVERSRALSPAGTLATVDAGAHMLVAMPVWSTERSGELLISSGLATMGFSLPAAIGAALARPNRRVVCFVGDGGLGMTLAELETLVRLRLDVTVVVFNDSTLTLIALKQRAEGQGGRRAVGYSPIDFSGVAASCGVPAWQVHAQSEFDSVFDRAISTAGPSLVDVRVDPTSYPDVISAIRGRRQ
ncbi:MAG TPA: thiamine pyrophosphate-binding protein [Jatrophihabitans sp.]|jgi:acetolactate synthase-1/2/3 large subunit